MGFNQCRPNSRVWDAILFFFFHILDLYKVYDATQNLIVAAALYDVWWRWPSWWNDYPAEQEREGDPELLPGIIAIVSSCLQL